MSQGAIFWFTGLSGAGKSTVAEAVKPLLMAQGYKVLILDGDEIRQRLHTHFDFSPEGIAKNNAAIAKLCEDQRKEYDVIFVAIISPYRHSRASARRLLEPLFFEVYFAADVATVSTRDVKGLYAKAKANVITNMIGFSAGCAYEAPERPDFIVDSAKDQVSVSIDSFYKFVNSKIRK